MSQFCSSCQAMSERVMKAEVEAATWKNAAEAAMYTLGVLQIYPDVGSAWQDLDTRASWTVLLVVPGAHHAILLQRDGLSKDQSSRASTSLKAFRTLWVAL